MKITAVIVARKGSKRIPNKMHQKIGGLSLVMGKVLQLTGCSYVNEVIVGSDDKSIQGECEKWGARFVLRQPEYCDEVSKTPNDMIKNMLSYFESDYVLWAHPTNPFIKVDHYNAAFRMFFDSQNKGFDSLFSATERKNHFWFEGRPVNHDPRSKVHKVAGQLEPLYEQNGGIFIRDYQSMGSDGMFIGKRPMIFPMDEITGWDIDERWELDVAQYLYRGCLVV